MLCDACGVEVLTVFGCNCCHSYMCQPCFGQADGTGRCQNCKEILKGGHSNGDSPTKNDHMAPVRK